jgi:PLAT/LH2 domain
MNKSIRPGIAAMLTSLLALVTLAGTASTARAAGAVETMPLWRLQVRITTGDNTSAGTTGKPALRFNGTSTGVRTLNPPSNSVFQRGATALYDLRLFATPSQLTMLRIGIAGTDDWCIKKTELIFNGRVAFAQDAVPGGGCAAVSAGTYLEYTSAALRANPAWVAYGTPPALPSGLTATSLNRIVTGVTGSAMLTTPGVAVTWDPAKPLSVVRKTSTSIGISFGVNIRDLSGIETPFKATISYDVRLSVGADGRLHATKTNASCCYHYTMSDAVVAQLDTALSRMTVRPQAPLPLRFVIDSLTNITWS